MTLEKDTISAIVICRNARLFIERCIASIRSQTITANEIIVIDGRSTDGTGEWLRQQPDLSVIVQAESGIADARNVGIAHASGNLIAFLDADDVWLPDKLRLQLSALQQDPRLEAVTGQLKKSGDDQNSFLAMTPGGFLFRKEVFGRYGFFDVRWKVACDHEWFLRIKRLGMRFGKLAVTVVHKTIHGNNLSIIQKGLYRQEMMVILREHHAKKHLIP